MSFCLCIDRYVYLPLRRRLYEENDVEWFVANPAYFLRPKV
jgi:hypothetical protein